MYLFYILRIKQPTHDYILIRVPCQSIKGPIKISYPISQKNLLAFLHELRYTLIQYAMTEHADE